MPAPRPPRRGRSSSPGASSGGKPAAKPPRRGAAGGSFDPYRRWLGIPAERRPPTHYDLLGVGPKEDDPETIEAAAARRKQAVRPELAGEHADAARRILYEIEEAKFGLLDPATRAAHDRRFGRNRKRRRSAVAAAPPYVVGGRARGEQSEIGRLFATLVAIPGVGRLTIYGVTFGFWIRTAPSSSTAAGPGPAAPPRRRGGRGRPPTPGRPGRR